MKRVQSIDLLRGAVMVLMAIDHVRVYAGVPAGGPDPAVFFTRWVTHFCAPAFLFLAGASSWLGQKPPRWFATRGLMLVALELTVMRFAWTFNFDYAHYVLFGVLWCIGWCFVLMAGLVKLPRPAVGLIGLAVIVLHNAAAPLLSKATPIVYGIGQMGPAGVLYCIVPWIGVMAAGYGFAPYFRDRRVCFATGGAAVALFVVLRAFNLYGDPRHFTGGLLDFLNTTKYPASLQFLCMTLGPLLLLAPWAETARAGWLRVFGRHPLLFYVLHIPLAHLFALGVALARHMPTAWLFANHPWNPGPAPEGWRWPLWLLYAVTALVVLLLYGVLKLQLVFRPATRSPLDVHSTPG